MDFILIYIYMYKILKEEKRKKYSIKKVLEKIP